jgi:dolichol-phosphate mannosyltransferase
MPVRRFDPSQRAHPLALRISERALGALAGSQDSCGDRDAARVQPAVLSVVVAARDEAANLRQLIDEITRALRMLCDNVSSDLARFEVVLVDDGSTDETQQVLADLSIGCPELCWVTFAAPAGQSSAIVAGILAARGNWIATIDADLQNDPADLVELWNALPGHDAALGWRVTREDVLSKRVISVCANWVRNLILGQSIHDTGCSVRIFSRESALRLPLFRGMHRFIGPLLLRQGARLIQLPVKHRPRANGRTHYNLWNRSICVLIDLLGVLWLMRRPVHYQVISQHRSQIMARCLQSETAVLRDRYRFRED